MIWNLTIRPEKIVYRHKRARAADGHNVASGHTRGLFLLENKFQYKIITSL